MEIVERDVFGSQEIAYECLADAERTDNFHRALQEVVALGQRVVELGTGTGILALVAASLGAERVDAYEISVPMARTARANAAANGLDDVVVVREADACGPLERHDGPYDLLIAEMISIGLVEEQLVPAFNNVLAQGLLKPTARVVPAGQRTTIELVEADFRFYGFELCSVQIEQTWQPSRVAAARSAPQLVHEVDFEAAVRDQAPIPESVATELRLVATSDGIVNAVRMAGESQLSPSVVSGWTQCMNSPAVVPLDPFPVRAGDVVDCSVRYRLGGEFAGFACVATVGGLDRG